MIGVLDAPSVEVFVADAEVVDPFPPHQHAQAAVGVNKRHLGWAWRDQDGRTMHAVRVAASREHLTGEWAQIYVEA